MISNFEERQSESPYIETVWRAEMSGSGEHILPAKGSWDIIFMKRTEKSQVLLVGPTSQAVIHDYNEDKSEYIGIRFKSSVYITTFNSADKLHTLQRLDYSGGYVVWLDNSRLAMPEFNTAESFVAQLVGRNLIAKDTVVEAVIKGVGTPTLSTRSIQRRFLRTTGIPPRSIKQIARAHEAVLLLEEGVSAVAAANETGYADQSHLTKSLRKIMGQRPSDIA